MVMGFPSGIMSIFENRKRPVAPPLDDRRAAGKTGASEKT
jgi:hypothetical protein